MKLSVTIDNVYEDGDEVTNKLEIEVTPDPDLDGDGFDDEDWVDDQLMCHTGTGRDGDAGYFLEITACAERPELVGRKWEWFG